MASAAHSPCHHSNCSGTTSLVCVISRAKTDTKREDLTTTTQSERQSLGTLTYPCPLPEKQSRNCTPSKRCRAPLKRAARAKWRVSRRPLSSPAFIPCNVPGTESQAMSHVAKAGGVRQTSAGTSKAVDD
eukprot:4234225-Amphidinium_carterae.1